MEHRKLSEIAVIHSGLVLGRKEADVTTEKVYSYKQLNLRSVSEVGSIRVDILDKFLSAERLSEQFITRENDIVMRLFAPLCPVLITMDYSELVVPSQFAIVRIKEHVVLPEFLWLYLSQKSVLTEISAAEGSHIIRSIKISTLSDTRIPMVPLKKQERITSFAMAHRNRKTLYLNLLHQYDVQADVIIKGAIGGQLQ